MSDGASEPGHDARREELLGASRGLAALLGIEMTVVGPDRVVARMEVTPDHLQPFGILHGGANLVLAETVASVGAYLAAGPGKSAFGMEINANHLRAVRSGVVEAEGTPIHLGTTTQVWEVEIRDAEGRLTCVSRCTLAVRG